MATTLVDTCGEASLMDKVTMEYIALIGQGSLNAGSMSVILCQRCLSFWVQGASRKARLMGNDRTQPPARSGVQTFALCSTDRK
jgi:hypothetical protein